MVFTRKKSRADANRVSPPRTQHKINICEVQTPSRAVFTQEQNELFVQQVVQDAQGLEGEVLHYHVLGLNYYSIEDYFKKPIVNWIFYFNLKNKHPQASADFCMINESKEGLEDILRHNDVMRRNKER